MHYPLPKFPIPKTNVAKPWGTLINFFDVEKTNIPWLEHFDSTSTKFMYIQFGLLTIDFYEPFPPLKDFNYDYRTIGPYEIKGKIRSTFKGIFFANTIRTIPTTAFHKFYKYMNNEWHKYQSDSRLASATATFHIINENK